MSEVRRFLLMQAGSRRYALALEQVAEVSELRTLSPVPRAPVWCLGATRSAGVVAAVIDLAWYLGEEPEPAPEKLVVLDQRLGGLALQVGQISSVMLEAPVRLEQDSYGTWLMTSDTKAELLDAVELIQEISAAMAR
ncbi:CheW-like domain-containing protein [Trichlorobacter thiogenes]|uniref:CheW-like domain-containing protein n=1 Tax=Trichlorobacter thiogenes TaxID=115783 RepID=A0A1T4JV52_9BACT|nr:chemotaxis protein CheW [Trichlorobacter thiogenes]SJZ34090.1 CheW-like domain-containing protein [Trichlorobacter thiogenes]